MLRRWNRLPGLAALLWLAACAPVVRSAPPDGEPTTHRVYVARNGWHTSIVVARRDLPSGRVPEAADLPAADFLEFGWGDREYFPAENPTIGMTLSAALIPTPSVVHLVGLARPPQPARPETEVLIVPVSGPGLDRLTARLDAAFERPPGGRAAPITPRFEPHRRFYPARGSFHLFNTCNTWVARKLAAAGLALSSSGVITASELMRRLRALPGVRRAGLRLPGQVNRAATRRP